MTARLQLWYFTHPALGRAAALAACVQALAITAVCAAPQAAASTNSMVLNWTGLRDTYGVPIGDYSLAIPSLRDQIAAAAPDLGVDPTTWLAWMTHAWATVASSLVAASVLTSEAGLFIGMVALALWLFKITVSTYWLAVIGEIARAIAGAVIQVTSTLGLVLLAVPIGVVAGVVTIKRGEAGRGWTMIGIALTMPAASIAIFNDPAGLMYGPDGLLSFGRRIGFSVATAATHNGALDGAAGGGQIDTLTASLITHTVREPLQLWNFGHVVDHVGGCGAAWSAAVHVGDSDGPIRAMAACGDRAAVYYAQHLDGMNAWVGLVLVAAAALMAWFMAVSGWAVLRVSVMAIWTTVILLPTLWLGAIPGAPQRRAADVVWQFFSHGIQTLIYIVYVSVVGLAVERIVSAPLPAQLGGTNPFAHVLMMGGVALAALMLLRHIRTDMSGRPSGGGLWRRAGSVALGMGMTAALGGAGSAAAQGIRGLRRRSDSRGETPTPWERMDAEAAVVHGSPQPGFDVAPALEGIADMRAGRSEVQGRRVVGENDRGIATADPSATTGQAMPSTPPAVAPMIDAHGGGVESARSGERPAAQRIRGAEPLALTSGEEPPPTVPAMADADHPCDIRQPEPQGDQHSPLDDNGVPLAHPCPGPGCETCQWDIPGAQERGCAD